MSSLTFLRMSFTVTNPRDRVRTGFHLSKNLSIAPTEIRVSNNCLHSSHKTAFTISKICIPSNFFPSQHKRPARERLTQIQGMSRLDHLWPEVSSGMSNASQRREKQQCVKIETEARQCAEIERHLFCPSILVMEQQKIMRVHCREGVILVHKFISMPQAVLITASLSSKMESITSK